jgi:hypothetical protein
MKAETLVGKLRELEGKGFNVRVSDGPFGPYLLMDFPDGSCDGWVVFDLDKPMQQKDVGFITGFLVSELEARGLRREILNYPDGYVCVVVEDANGYEVADIGGASELEALTKACLSLPTKDAP